MAANWNKFEKFFANRNVKNNASHLIEHIKPNSKIIDVGCGMGSITLDFAKRAPEGSVLGIDVTERSIEIARAAAEKAGITNVEFKVADVKALSQYQDDSFDIAHCHQVLIYLPDPVEAIRQMRRIVKPGGVVSSRDVIYHSQFDATPLIRENVEKFWQGTRDRGGYGGGGGLANHTWMHKAGFKLEQITHDCVGYTYDREELSTVGEGQIEFAKLRGESEEYVATLTKDLEEWSANPESRSVIMDGWAVGVK